MYPYNFGIANKLLNAVYKCLSGVNLLLASRYTLLQGRSGNQRKAIVQRRSGSSRWPERLHS